jgi:TonB family protein
MRIRFGLFCAAALLVLSAPVRGADPVWIQLTSRNFVVYTDTTEIKGRRLLEDFEGRLAALSTVLGGVPQRQFPVEVFLFSKKEEFSEAIPPAAKGIDGPIEFDKGAYLWRGPDRIFVGARDKSPADIADDVGHALGHVYSSRLSVWRPFWLAEASGEYFRKVGRPPDNKKVPDKEGYPVADLLEIVRTKNYDDDAPLTPGTAAFRTQSYRLLRVLMARHGTELASWLKELRTATEQEPKLNVDVKTLQSEFDAYSDTVAGPGSGTFDIKTPSLTPAAMAVHRGDLLVAANKTSQAGAFYNGGAEEARAARAVLARFSRSGGEPIRLLARVSSELPNASLAHFHFGSIETKEPGDLELQARALERAITQLPLFGRARAQLARVDTIRGKGEEALPHIDRALELEPEFADEFYMIRAEALLSLSRFGEANTAARTAAAMPHAGTGVDYDLKASEMARRIEETRRELDNRQLQRIRGEVDAIVAAREPPPPPPPPRPPERFGKIEYSVQANRQISIVNAPLPIYSNTLIQRAAVGNITVRITIGPDGKVTQASIVESQLQEMNTSTVDAAKKWTFAPLTGTGSVEARVVFRFTVQ